MDMLDQPYIRALLPACARDPLKVVPENVNGFTTNLNFPINTQVPGELSWSSYGKDDAVAEGRFESARIPASKLPFLEFRVAGDLGKPGLSLLVLDLATGKTTAVKPRKAGGHDWQTCDVKAPRGDFKIIATDQSETGWFAFQPPRELGWLSAASATAASTGRWLFFVGVGLYGATMALALRRRDVVVALTQK